MRKTFSLDFKEIFPSIEEKKLRSQKKRWTEDKESLLLHLKMRFSSTYHVYVLRDLPTRFAEKKVIYFYAVEFQSTSDGSSFWSRYDVEVNDFAFEYTQCTRWVWINPISLLKALQTPNNPLTFWKERKKTFFITLNYKTVSVECIYCQLIAGVGNEFV